MSSTSITFHRFVFIIQHPEIRLISTQHYNFWVVKEGTDGRRSMLQPAHWRQSSAAMGATRSNKSTTQSDDNEDDETLPHASSFSSGPIGVPTSESTLSENAGSKQAATSPDTAMDDITTAMSSLKFVPPSVRFGRGGAKGGLARH